MIRKGNQGNEVWQWQEFLVNMGYNITIDGVFGTGTHAATVAYQQWCGLTADGVVGPNTYYYAVSHGYAGDYAPAG
jgi:peptidoglycan hydrolase-like protein with peptidoglycan-binding domain